MFLKRNRNGYSWHCTVQNDGKGEKLQESEWKYVSFNFAKDCEPAPYELNEYQSYEGDLIFRDKTGAERVVFPYIDGYHNSVTFRILGKKEYEEKTVTIKPKTEPKWDLGWQQHLDGSKDEEYWRRNIKDIPTSIDDEELDF